MDQFDNGGDEQPTTIVTIDATGGEITHASEFLDDVDELERCETFTFEVDWNDVDEDHPMEA